MVKIKFTHLFEPMLKAMDPIFDSIRQRFVDIERRVSAIESGSTIADAYRGTYLPGTRYKRGDLLTHRGGLWLCLEATADKPGATVAWRLIVKRGQEIGSDE